MRILLLTVTVMVLAACGSSQKDKAILEEAGEVHTEAMEIEQNIKPQLEELAQLKNSINVQGRALTPEEIKLVERIGSIQNSYAYWETHHMEVPGHEHDHQDHAHHDHNHGAKLELSPQDMLSVQREFRDSIISIRERVETTLQAAKGMRGM